MANKHTLKTSSPTTASNLSTYYFAWPGERAQNGVQPEGLNGPRSGANMSKWTPIYSTNTFQNFLNYDITESSPGQPPLSTLIAAFQVVELNRCSSTRPTLP